MLRSMTGFGRCLVDNNHCTQQWEIKSVNGRHLDLKWHLPVWVRSQEARLEKIVRRHATRGRVDISLILHDTMGTMQPTRLDTAQATSMMASLQEFALQRGLTFTPDCHAFLHIPALWIETGEELDDNTMQELEAGLTLALEDWNEARISEGRALATELQSHILRMEAWIGLISERAPVIKEDRMEALHERLGEILARYGQELEQGRFLQEIVILADRLDVTEELTRLSTHLSHLRDLLESGIDVGRRLDFTLQECFREITTLGNKLPDVQLSRTVVDFKNELEKCREQVQNLE